MSEESNVFDQTVDKVEGKMSASRDLKRILRFSAVRLLMLVLTVATGVFLTIMIANMGGYVDNIQRGVIRENLATQMQSDQAYKEMAQEDRQEYLAALVALEEERQGLNDPFVLRAVKYLTNAMVLDLGRAVNMTSDEGSKEVRNIIIERLPPTLLLMGSANMFIFFGSIFTALAASRKYGSLWDKIIIALSPTSSAPSWFYGLFFILIFAAIFQVLPFGGLVDSPPPSTKLGYALSVAKHTLLPATAIIFANLFITIYTWRTFFLIYSSEDYVEMAKAKGLSDREIERRYILRPTLPNIITNFSLLIIGLWTGTIITETVFNWPGLGRTFYTAIGQYDTPVIVGNTIIFAYLLAVTVFLLDFVYALVDPRIKLGQGSSQ